MKLKLIGLLCLGIFSVSAHAETAKEKQLWSAPMPHEQLGDLGKGVRVHYVRMHGRLEGSPPNDVRLARLKRDVSECVRALQSTGRATNPPKEWPDDLNSVREDAYYAPNRVIRYSSGIAYAMSPADCSLMEVYQHRASLTSLEGSCTIDLEKKTAKGACGPDGHARASATLPPPPPFLKEAMKRMEGNPEMMAMARKAMAGANTSTGKTRTILGIECEIWNQPYGGRDTMCLTNKGSFNPNVGATLVPGLPGVALDADSETGVKMRAKSAKLDATVNPDVFTPYKQGGFTFIPK